MKEYKFKINGKDYTVCINSVNDGVADLSVNGKAYEVEISQPDGVAATPVSQSAAKSVQPSATAPANDFQPTPKSAQPSSSFQNAAQQSKPTVAPQSTAAGKGEEVKSPLPGVIIGISVNVGDKVKEGQEVAVLEAMKMENSIEASVSGTITAINVQKGDSVPEGAVLLTIG